jgi:hypothetical protein
VKATILRSCIRQRVSDFEQSPTRARRRRDGWRAAAALRCARNWPARDLFAGRRGTCRLDSFRLAPRLSGSCKSPSPPGPASHEGKAKGVSGQCPHSPCNPSAGARCLCQPPCRWSANGVACRFPGRENIHSFGGRVECNVSWTDKEGQPRGVFLFCSASSPRPGRENSML